MVSAASDIVSNVSLQNSRAKSTRDDQPSLTDSFSSLVDSNTAPTSASSDRSLTAQQPDIPAPARRDDRSDDQPRRNDTGTDQASAAPAPDRNTPAPANNSRDPGKSDKDDTKVSAKDDSKSDGKTKDAGKDDKAVKTDPDKAAPAEQPVAVTAVAVAIPVPTATTDTTKAATPQTAGAAQPAAIAAAVLKAQTAATDAAGTAADKTTATASTEGDETFAALIATATPASGKAAAKKTTTSETAASASTSAKTDAKTDSAATAPTTDAPVAATPAVAGGKTDATSADGAKPDVTADAVKPAAAKGHDQHAEPTVQAAPDLTPQPPALQQPLPQTAAAAPTAQLTATVATGAAIPLNGVAVEIAQSVKAGKSSFEIRLDPAELGRIDVRLDVDKHGNVTSHLTVEKPETLSMLRQDAPQLQRALEQAGLKTNDGGMQFSLRDQSSGQQQQQNGENAGRNAQRLVISEDESLPAVPAARGYGRMLGSSSGVDISI